MKFYGFAFSLYFWGMVSAFFEINTKLKIQIWHVSEKRLEMEEISHDKQFQFYSSETYIVLEKTWQYDIYHYNLFYWVGLQSPLVKRIITVASVALLQNYLKKIQNSKLIFFGREMEGHESEKFCNLFGLEERPEVINLYYVQGLGGHIITLPPVPRTEFYTTDTYVLLKRSEIVIWIGEDAIVEKVNAANTLAKRILKVDLQIQDLEIKKDIYVIDDLHREKDNEQFYKHFLQYVSELKRDYCPAGVYMVLDPKIKENWNAAVTLHEIFFDHERRIQVEKIFKRPLFLDRFQIDQTYILSNIDSGYMFVYLGNEASLTLIEFTLTHVEKVNYGNLEKWKKITIVRSGELLPTDFIIHFGDEIRKLVPPPESYTFDNSMINKIKISEASSSKNRTTANSAKKDQP